MDPNAVVLEISSDEDVGWDGYDDAREIPDDHNWIAELLDEVNRGDDCCFDDDDSDDVVVVSEVLPSRKPRKKFTSKSSSLIDLDDDCLILDHDPDKPLETLKDNPIDQNQNSDNDSDDLVVVSEKGQVACRDYPHPRHLCIKFPFSSTPNQNHCDQCYCYVCDSLAPCIYWGNGSSTIDHCHATEKDDFWKVERQNSKKGNKVIQPLLPEASPMIQTPSISISRPNPIRASTISTNYSASLPNIINQTRTPVLLPRNKFQPGLVSQQLTRTTSCNNPRDRGYHNYSNLNNPYTKPVFKRTVSAGVESNVNRYFYHRNLFDEQALTSNIPFDFLPNFQAQVNLDPYVVDPPPVVFQAQSSLLPNYSLPTEPSLLQGQRSTIDPKFFNDINWPQSQTNHQSVNEPLVASASASASVSNGLVDCPYDNWVYDNETREPEVSGSFGLNEFCTEPAFIDTENEGRHWC